MQFIECADGSYVNADSVEKWRKATPTDKPAPLVPGEPPPPDTWTLLDTKGQTLGNTITDPALFAWPVVPAYPGFRVLLIVPDDEPYIEEHHVIGWRISPVGDFPMPVTLTDVPDTNCVIQSPTDRIIAQGGGEYVNREALLTAYKEAKAKQ